MVGRRQFSSVPDVKSVSMIMDGFHTMYDAYISRLQSLTWNDIQTIKKSSIHVGKYTIVPWILSAWYLKKLFVSGRHHSSTPSMRLKHVVSTAGWWCRFLPHGVVDMALPLANRLCKLYKVGPYVINGVKLTPNYNPSCPFVFGHL